MSENWYVVGPPWGDGTWIVEGDPDPHMGVNFVADCQHEMDDLTDPKIPPVARAEQIAREHNSHEALIGALEEALALLAASLTAEQIVREHNAHEALCNALMQARSVLRDPEGTRLDARTVVRRIDEALALAHPQGDEP